VAKKCLDCDELLLSYPNKRRCKKCKRLWDNERSKKNQKRIRDKKGLIAGDNGKCITCGVDISHFYASRLRCDKCRGSINYKQPIVARKCTICGEVFAKSIGLYCSDECRKIAKSRQQKFYHTTPTKYKKHITKPKPLSTDERYNEIKRISEKYVRNNFKKLVYDQKVEALGTFATAQVFVKNKDCGIRKKKDGTLDCEKEKQTVNFLRRKTYSDDGYQYSGTEGDFIRNVIPHFFDNPQMYKRKNKV